MFSLNEWSDDKLIHAISESSIKTLCSRNLFSVAFACVAHIKQVRIEAVLPNISVVRHIGVYSDSVYPFSV